LVVQKGKDRSYITETVLAVWAGKYERCGTDAAVLRKLESRGEEAIIG
jgi:hypothetical protein